MQARFKVDTADKIRMQFSNPEDILDYLPINFVRGGKILRISKEVKISDLARTMLKVLMEDYGYDVIFD